MKKIFLIVLVLIAILSLSAVQAAENITEQSASDSEDIISEDNIQKEDLNVEIDAAEYIVKPNPNDGYSTIELKNLPQDYHSGISVYIDDQFIVERSDKFFDYDVNLRGYDYGKHIVLVVLPETPKYNPLNVTHEFEVVEGYIKIDETIKTNEGVHVELKEGATGYLTVNVDGKEFKKVKINAPEYDTSHAYVNLGTLPMGIHTVEAIYSGDANNKKITKKANVNVIYEISMMIAKPYAAKINGIESNAYGSEFNTLSILLPSDAKSSPVVTIDGVKFDAIREYDTYFSVNTSHLKPGDHILNVTYPGDSKYSPSTVMDSFKTIVAIGTVFIKGYDYEYNNTIIILNLPDDNKGNLSVFIDDELYKSVPVTKEGAKIQLSDMKIGKHTIDAIYTGDDYDVKNITSEITVIPKVTYPRQMLWASNESFYIETNPDAKLNVNVEMDGKKFAVELVEGKGNFSLSSLRMIEMGEDDYAHNEIRITYSGDYNKTHVYSVEVDPYPSRLVGAKDVTMYYGDSKTYTLTVWGSHGTIVGAGQTVIVRLGSQYLYPTTDKNGLIKVKINNVPGTYKITATYKNAVVTKKIVVKQPLTLKTVTVKKSAKKLTLQATLKKGKTPIKNKQIVFKFNGKTYKAKTDKKGVVKVTVKSSVLKKLKVGKKITYQATYLKDTVKKTAKVKK